ncbi:MAG: KTSC domain-containing protein [Phenylobacterium sp.]|uniref:KTSC domain-containing protein n=1 Tax=Phenylobacterium sp. TaxID=1871053 RepID=UPI002736D7FA|nr:KTSC domain-containing protein [Phenylobacterium sp.]MDP3173960.1 KTSC domain-containing protein [Phenylobacterium sp.]
MQVDSDAISEITYDPRRARLFVRFRSGEAYAYRDVPAGVHEAFMAAESKGRFFQDEVRDRYGFERLRRR